MPATETAMSSGGTATESSVPADDNENLFDAGPFDAGRFDVNLKATEQTITAQ